MKSVATSLVSLFVLLFSGLLMIFVTSGSGSVGLGRVAMEGDLLLSERINQERKAAESQFASRDMGDDTPAAPAKETKVVLWISVPGFRNDYMTNADTPYLDDVSQGRSTALIPPFPSTTFPAHATLATGQNADKHGIPANGVRTEDGALVTNPMNDKFLTAEPIWRTATRQGVKTIVHDWPLSQNQEGEHAAAGFLTSYDPALTDQQRLDALYEAWAADTTEEPPRLLMCRLNSVFEAGMLNGPREEDTYKSVITLDTTLKTFLAKVQENWDSLASPEHELIVLVTTDHGLGLLKKYINLKKILGDEWAAKMEVVHDMAVANIWLKDLPESEAEKNAFIENFDRELKARIYWKTYYPEEVPADYHYNIPGRIGERVLVLKRGFAFTDLEAEEAVFDPADGDGKFGAYGYPVAELPRMKGQLLIWSANGSGSPGGDFGDVTSTQLHPTVCRLLGIESAEGVTAKPLQ